ncbi:lipoprotein [Paraburkholderia caffeinilytica]|uniref:Lipoprotein n=1 Tax=Paraburkholderia caffeinilytica TaxID=1761016 RepID=A0ABQ1LDB4_9BURK|nr:hypothetical protein [Paraburkholderia caffeinilytica]AXL51500.1 lipoprotein [Paraburkholderia caffeinilytica]GGC20628.1 hypothetical protein GCM10011400_03730 [Paraburkholderia caffeinilytica]CAB3778471.1 hypothetical protein LMG28690_00695 [Paraburkholderia caffeinilytica]
MRAGAGAALVTAALLMSACADASSTTGDAASASSTQTNATANAVSDNDSPRTARSRPDEGLAANATNGAAVASADQPASASRPALELAKAKQLAAEQRVAARVPAASGMTEKRSRPLTLRDSGIDGSLMFARDVDFRVTGDIGFMIHDMAATLTPAHAGQPIVFDDPTSVTINVHRGEVTLDSARLTAIFDRYLFQYQGSPLRNMRVVPQDGGTLRITGEMHRDTWVPIVLTGSLSMRNADDLVFHASHVEVAGVGADKLMQAAHVKMADLLKVDTPIARLDGDDVVMQVARLTPPPALRMTITQIDASAAGVRFTLDDHTVQKIDWPATMPPRGMLVQGGDVKFMRSMPMNIDMALTPLDTNAPFVLDLYHYREQMAAGYFTFDEAGALDVHLPSYPMLASAVKEGSTQIGSARARFNDSFIRAQQVSLAQARLVWRHVPQTLRTASIARAMPVGTRAAFSGQSMAAPGAALGDERHSSGSAPLIHVENVDFYVSGRVGFHVRSLDAQMVPKKPGQPVDLDDPDQYDIRIIGGEVVEPWPAMAALFNDYLLDYEPRSLNDLQLKPVDGKLQVTGGIKLWNHFPGVWLPTTMSGTIVARDERHLVYEPTSVKVLGVPQAGLLRALDIPLASLTPFARKGVALKRNELVFDQYTVFPPPVLQGRLASATVTDEGLVLKFKRDGSVAVARPPAGAAKSFVWIESGDVKMFNSLVTNGRTFIKDSSNPGVMRFDLYGYRRDVSRGTVRMGEDGGLEVDVAARR